MNTISLFASANATSESLLSKLVLPLPWTQTNNHQKQDEYHCLASELPLNRYQDMPRFLLWTLRIRKQLKTAQGLIGYRLKADLLRKTFTTLSAWENPNQMMAFVKGGTHKRMLDDMKGRLGASRFVEWQAKAETLPLTWKTATEKLGPD